MAFIDNHDPIKFQKIAATAAVALEQNLVVPGVMQREGIDQFKGAKDDTITVTVDGVLPYRSYGWRNDRSEEIQFDEYKERKVAVTFGGDVYSAVRITDEQREFDFDGWAKLVAKQTEAVGDGLERKAIEAVTNQEYVYEVGVHESKLQQGLVEARRVLNALRAPGSTRTLLVGTDWESALLLDPRLNLAHNVGESEAVSSLTEATIGKRYGFNIVVAQELEPSTAIAMVPSAFIFATGAPGIPASVPAGSRASHNGVAVRWVMDYDMTRTTDRSLVNTYQSFRPVKDLIVGHDAEGQRFISEHEHFVRAIKLTLNGDSKYPTKGQSGANGEIAKLTGLVAPTNLGPDAPADPEA